MVRLFLVIPLVLSLVTFSAFANTNDQAQTFVWGPPSGWSRTASGHVLVSFEIMHPSVQFIEPDKKCFGQFDRGLICWIPAGALTVPLTFQYKEGTNGASVWVRNPLNMSQAYPILVNFYPSQASTPIPAVEPSGGDMLAIEAHP